MLSQPAPSGWHRTVGIIGVGGSVAAAARGDAALRLAAVGPGIACKPDNSATALGLAVALADDAVEDVVNGPLSSEQPFLQPVAAVPTNVGFDGPIMVVLRALARTLFALALATGAPPRTPTSTTERDNSTNRLRTMLLRMRASLRAGPRNVCLFGEDIPAGTDACQVSLRHLCTIRH
jgi:hypothetical protein